MPEVLNSKIMVPIDEPWNVPGRPLGVEIVGMTPEVAEQAFLAAYAECVG